MRKLAAGTTNLQHNRLHSASCAAVGLYRRSRKHVTSITILGRTPHDEDACLLKIAHFWNMWPEQYGFPQWPIGAIPTVTVRA
jgi:hypothetical protein